MVQPGSTRRGEGKWWPSSGCDPQRVWWQLVAVLLAPTAVFVNGSEPPPPPQELWSISYTSKNAVHVYCQVLLSQILWFVFYVLLRLLLLLLHIHRLLLFFLTLCLWHSILDDHSPQCWRLIQMWHQSKRHVSSHANRIAWGPVPRCWGLMCNFRVTRELLFVR